MEIKYAITLEQMPTTMFEITKLYAFWKFGFLRNFSPICQAESERILSTAKTEGIHSENWFGIQEKLFMFRFLQFIVAIILFIGTFILLKKMHKSRAFITGISVILIISSVCAGVLLNTIPMPTEVVQVEATKDSSFKAHGNIVGIKSVIVDGKEYPIGKPFEGTWYYSKDDSAYLWLNEDDKRLTEPVTQEIIIKVPVGAGRQLIFLGGEQFGIVKVSYGDKSATYDLYQKESAVKSITIPDSNRAYDDFVKLCRLGGYSAFIVIALILAFWFARHVNKEHLIKLICMGLSVITTLTFCLNLGLTARSGRSLFALLYDFNSSFSGNFVLPVILAPMLYKTFLYCGGIYRKNFVSIRSTLCIALPASLFSAFMVIGAAFINGKNTLRPIFDNELQVLKSLFAVSGYFAVFFFGITWIFNCLDCIDVYKSSNKSHIRPIQIYLDNLRKRPFITALITFLIVYIPILIISYPGMLMADSPSFLRQTYGTEKLNNAHPVLYVLFVKLCMRIGGTLFESANAGIFISVVTQTLFAILTVSVLIKFLVEANISNKTLILSILYFSFHPRIHSHFLLNTKEAINATFLLLFMVSLYMLFTRKQSVCIYILLVISDLGAILFRHDSYYAIILSMIIACFLMRSYKKQLILIAMGTLTFMLTWNSILLPAFNVLETKEWWMSDVNTSILSNTMLQQTGRYIRDAGDEVTEEEKNVISACLDYEQIVEEYQPDKLADGMANLLKLSTMTQDDWNAYQRVWLQMFVKHPEIYFEATLNHKYRYLYPVPIGGDFRSTYARGEHWMTKINAYNFEEMPGKFSYLESTSNLRSIYEGIRETFFSIPVFNILFTTSSFFWILLIWLAYAICKKSAISISIMLPLLCLVIALILGPSNGDFFRYSYTYVFCLPIIIILGLSNMKCQSVEKNRGSADENTSYHPRLQ